MKSNEPYEINYIQVKSREFKRNQINSNELKWNRLQSREFKWNQYQPLDSWYRRSSESVNQWTGWPVNYLTNEPVDQWAVDFYSRQGVYRYIERERERFCIYIYISYILSATVPAGHQGSVSNKKSSCQLPVAGASPGEIADFLNSFKGPHGTNPGITWNQS